MILGILAAVAVPKLFDSANDARVAATRHSLVVVRDSIQLYRAQNGSLPGDAGTMRDFISDVMTILNGPFPVAAIGNTGKTVRVTTSGAALSPSGPESWAYDNRTGEFILNHADGADW